MQLNSTLATVSYDVGCGMANADGEIDDNVEKKWRPQYEKFVILANRVHNIMFLKIDILTGNLKLISDHKINTIEVLKRWVF